MKIVINACCGGFCLSKRAYKELGLKWDGFGHAFDIERSDPLLVACVEKLGKKANGEYADLKIIEIPDGINWYVDSGEQGYETIHENHRAWSYPEGEVKP